MNGGIKYVLRISEYRPILKGTHNAFAIIYSSALMACSELYGSGAYQCEAGVHSELLEPFTHIWGNLDKPFHLLDM